MRYFIYLDTRYFVLLNATLSAWEANVTSMHLIFPALNRTFGDISLSR